MTIRLHLTSVFVDDQEQALRFYTEVLGFEPRTDVPIGNGDRWLTVGAPGQDVELLLEPAGHPAVRPYREALAEDGIPLASFVVDDIHQEHDRLVQADVTFTQPPTEMGPVTTAVIDTNSSRSGAAAERATLVGPRVLLRGATRTPRARGAEAPSRALPTSAWRQPSSLPETVNPSRT